MAAKKKNDGQVVIFIVLGIVGVWLLPKMFGSARGITSSGGGGSYYPGRYGGYGTTTDQGSWLQNLLRALGMGSGSGSGRGSSASPLSQTTKQNQDNAQKQLNALLNSGPLTIQQALLGGFATNGVQQGVLAGIFNVQNGYAYEGDQTIAQQGQSWLDQNNWGLADLFSTEETSLPFQNEQQLLDFGNWGSSVYNSPYDYADTVYGGYADYGTGGDYIDYPSADAGGVGFSDGGGWSGGDTIDLSSVSFDAPEQG